MKLFKIQDNHFNTRGFSYVQGYGPIPGEMPFLRGQIRDSKLAYWALSPRPPGFYTGEAGVKWGDFMMCGAGPMGFLVSQRVVGSIEKLNCVITHCTRMPVAEVRSKKLKSIPPPDYFVLQVGGGVDVDWAGMGIELDDQNRPVYDPVRTLKPIPKLDSWNGADVFSWKNWGVGSGLTLLCTEKVVEIAEREKWTNVRFEPLGC